VLNIHVVLICGLHNKINMAIIYGLILSKECWFKAAFMGRKLNLM